ncbi:MAG: glycosyltransferase family 2 protein [Patescibacteria group bacterium]|mgnify:CR=1 FL=1
MAIPKLSVIIVNYRSSDALEHCLRSLHVATKASLEIILIDNSPEEGAQNRMVLGGAKKVLQAGGWHSHYFPQADNIGYTKAANHGARHALGETLCFLNPDMILEAHSLDRMLAWVEQHPRTVVGPRERNVDGQIVTTAFPFVTRRYVWGANLLYKFPWPRSWQPTLPWLVPPYQYARRCCTATEPFIAAVLSGSCLVMLADVWRTVGDHRFGRPARRTAKAGGDPADGGGWNEELTYFGLESEWFKRARDAGVTAWYLPAAEVFHEHAQSIRRADHWRVRDEADRNRRWHARRFGLAVLAILAVVLWLEEKFRPSRRSF